MFQQWHPCPLTCIWVQAMGGPGKRLERRKWGWTIYSPGPLLAGNAQLVTTLIWRVPPESCSLLIPGMTPFSHSVSPVELPNRTALPLTVSLKSVHIGVISSTVELSSDHPDWMRFKQDPGRKGQVHSDWVSIFLVISKLWVQDCTCIWDVDGISLLRWTLVVQGTSAVLVSLPKW